MRKHSIKLRPKRCEVFRYQVRCIGQIVFSKGVQIHPKDMWPVLQLKEREPQTVGEVRTLLGFFGYYRSFIQYFSRMAKPLFELLQSPSEEKGETAKPKSTRGNTQVSIQWTAVHRAIAAKLVDMLTNPPILGYTDCDLPFVLMLPMRV
jgi:hypothetical protein